MNWFSSILVVVVIFMVGAFMVSFLDDLNSPLIDALTYNGFY